MSKFKQYSDLSIDRMIRNIVTIDLPDGELEEIIDICTEIVDESYNGGHDNGYELGHEDGYKDGQGAAFDNESAVEKICTEYVVEKFSDCKTLEDFTSVFKEIETRSFNFMH